MVCSHERYECGLCTVCGDYEPAVLNGDVYEISNANELYWFAQQVNSGNNAINGKLMDNIVVNEGTITAETTDARVWTPIGNNDNQYTGTFKGNGKTISGLFFSNPEVSFVGLFGFVGTDGEIRNVGVVNSYFCGVYGVSGVAGYNCGTVTDCYSTGTVSGDNSVGGVVGENWDGTATNCYFNSDKYSGNAVGIDKGTVTNVEGKTTAQFASGEVAYLLGEAFGQNIDNGGVNEGYPVFSDATVYKVLSYDGTTEIYSNTNANKTHNFEKGVCTVCGYEDPDYVAAPTLTPIGFTLSFEDEILVNASLTAEQKALVKAYDASYFTGAVKADANKLKVFASTGSGFQNASVTVSFEGAFTVNYYFLPNAEVDGELTLHIWTPEDYKATSQLTAENACSVISMTKQDNGTYWGQVTGIAAKNLDETYYVSVIYTDADGNTHCSGVVAYALSTYCMNNAKPGKPMQELASATAMYGYYAKQYFTT